MNNYEKNRISLSIEGQRYRCIQHLRWLVMTALVSLVCITGNSCRRTGETIGTEQSPANLQHALSLVDSVQVGGQTLMYINIYADYPSYQPIGAPGEGIACVDDAGRFMEVLETEIIEYGRRDLIPLARGITRFLLYLQRADGLWYNFIYADGSINKTHKNSKAEFSWWAARGMRGLAAAYNIFRGEEKEFADTLQSRFQLSARHFTPILRKYPTMNMTPLGLRAGWIPNDAPDRIAEYLLALAKMHRMSPLNYAEEIDKLTEGILSYQYRQAESSVDGMFFCWRNVWHNWGNLQALAVLKAYEVLGDSTYLEVVERWANHYLIWAIAQGYFWEISVGAEDSIAVKEYPQIAYGISSTYRGIRALAKITGDPDYSTSAETIFQWFHGKNRASQAMYDAATGRCFDGIQAEHEINRNSGAESTIEALLALQASITLSY
ncbi:hypothetical protein ACFL45_08370 [Candidatus Neomarinimicrobiota bacterium]